MKPIRCRDFLALLEEALRNRPGPETPQLSWHEHLLGCPSCRALIQAEQALEELLASLPEPRLPTDLAERLLARLVSVRRSPDRSFDRSFETARADLDELLELETTPAPPPGLGARVLSGLDATRRDERLERVLDFLPVPEVPVGLTADVLASLEPVRRPAPRLRLLRGGLRLAAAAAVLFVLSWGARQFFGASLEVNEPEVDERVASGASATPSEPGLLQVEDALLASLDVLENWDLLVDEDVDLILGALDALDETLIEIGTGVLPEEPEEPADGEEPEHG